MANYYEILGVKQNDNSAKIKKAYKKLALKYHPDRNSGDKSAEEKFKKITKAYEVLKDEQSRRKYDQKLANQPKQNNKRENRQQTKQRRPNGFSQGDFQDFEKEFANFFGFNPKTKEKIKKDESSKDRFNTDDLFKQYFGVNNKKG
jgi:DnaJ-class molecular chaperone